MQDDPGEPGELVPENIYSLKPCLYGYYTTFLTFSFPTGRQQHYIMYNYLQTAKLNQLEMWANAQRDGHPAKCRWRPLFKAAKFG